MRTIEQFFDRIVVGFRGLSGVGGWVGCSLSDNDRAKANALFIVILAGNHRRDPLCYQK